MKRRYSVVLTPQPEGGYTVTSPDVLDLLTEGDTREEALRMARDCAEALILTYLDHGEEIPEEGGRAEVATIEADVEALRARLAAEKAAQYAAHNERLEQRVRVLERIVTDKGLEVSDEIERLRDRPLN